jgi:hypothetical protein
MPGLILSGYFYIGRVSLERLRQISHPEAGFEMTSESYYRCSSPLLKKKVMLSFRVLSIAD